MEFNIHLDLCLLLISILYTKLPSAQRGSAKPGCVGVSGPACFFLRGFSQARRLAVSCPCRQSADDVRRCSQKPRDTANGIAMIEYVLPCQKLACAFLLCCFAPGPPPLWTAFLLGSPPSSARLKRSSSVPSERTFHHGNVGSRALSR